MGWVAPAWSHSTNNRMWHVQESATASTLQCRQVGAHATTSFRKAAAPPSGLPCPSWPRRACAAPRRAPRARSARAPARRRAPPTASGAAEGTRVVRVEGGTRGVRRGGASWVAWRCDEGPGERQSRQCWLECQGCPASYDLPIVIIVVLVLLLIRLLLLLTPTTTITTSCCCCATAAAAAALAAAAPAHNSQPPLAARRTFMSASARLL